MAERPVCDVRIASKGPRFFRTEDGVMFEIQIDSRSRIGPRPMISADKHQYPAAWQAFTRGEPAEPLRPRVEFVDLPEAKAAHDREAAERQRQRDAKRGGGQ